MATARAWVGALLRTWADRIDYDGAVKRTGLSFTFEHRQGVRLRQDGRGCPVYYMGETDYQRAHDEADTEHAVVDWKAAAGYRPGRAPVSYRGGPHGRANA